MGMTDDARCFKLILFWGDKNAGSPTEEVDQLNKLLSFAIDMTCNKYEPVTVDNLYSFIFLPRLCVNFARAHLLLKLKFL